MATEEYVVYYAPDQKWGLQFKGRNLALFPEKAQEIRPAVAIAHATATPDAPTTVLDKGSGGESCTLWTFGKDAYTAG